eukprot:6548008-Alexandrium_andersonii.AAC.1
MTGDSQSRVSPNKSMNPFHALKILSGGRKYVYRPSGVSRWRASVFCRNMLCSHASRVSTDLAESHAQ